MTEMRIQEWNKEGEPLEWVGPLLSIADELLAEWEHPDAGIILKMLSQPAAMWPWSVDPLSWFIEQMDKHTKAYNVCFTGEVVA